jgi:hypothetical protein
MGADLMSGLLFLEKSNPEKDRPALYKRAGRASWRVGAALRKPLARPSGEGLSAATQLHRKGGLAGVRDRR